MSISIPYGAIKRIPQMSYFFYLFIFQFLMVRLKAYVEKPLQLRL